MGRTIITTVCGAALLLALASPAAAEGLRAENVQATFKTSRKGIARHSLKVRGMVTDTTALRSFRPDESGLLVRVGEFVAISHTPDPEDDTFRMKKGVWRWKTKVNGVKTKLRIDTRSGALRLDVKKGNASKLRDGGPQYAVVRLELGSRVLEDAVIFDERRRGGSLQWRSLAHGIPIEPPVRPDGTPLPGGTLPYTILSRGEQSQILQPTVMIARNETEWQAMYDLAIFTVPNQRPGVDFTQEMVIGVFTGLVSQIRQQEVDVTAVTDTGNQLHVSWRSRFLCTEYPCAGGLQTSCPDFSPFVFVRVRRIETQHVSNRAPDVYNDCP